MIKKPFLKFVLATMALSILASSSSITVLAENNANINPTVGGNISIGKCIEKGNFEFILFLNTLIYNDGFFDAVLEPFEDILWRNKCHATDVMGLINQQDKIRKYIRGAFLTCNTQRLPALKKAFHELNAEIYYVRNIVDGKIVLNLPFDLLSTRMIGNPDSIFTPSQVIYEKMISKYVKKDIFTPEAFDQFFAKLEFKYKDRKKTYVICENDSWKTVAEKWQEFIDTAGGITPAWKNFKKGVGGRAEKIGEIAKSITDDGILGNLKGLVQVNLNGVDINSVDFKEIAESIGGNIPDFSSKTQSGYYKDITTSGALVDTVKMREQLSSNFEALYLNTSDSSIAVLVKKLNEWDQTIVNSLPVLDQILQCSKTMNKRQCPNSK